MGDKWRTFTEIDPFNPQNTLTGRICHEQGEEYGKIILTRINDKPCKQIIYSTPKMYYPFDKKGNFYFKQPTTPTVAYIKYDGTNIVGYSYYYQGTKYITYKTRLNPVLKSGRFGNFYEMWCEILQKYQQIPKIILKEDINLSFELHGILNKILILYPFRLDIRLLFGITPNGSIIRPEQFAKYGIPIAERYYEFKIGEDFPKTYNELRDELEKSNEVKSDSEIVGLEGLVIYQSNEDGTTWEQWKLKPETIFKIHTKPEMSKKDIMITCYNALENVDIDGITFEFVGELLLEEFTENEITRNEYKIKQIIKEVKEELQLRNEIITTYKELNLSVKEDKTRTMRTLSQYFPSNRMRYVYTIINAYEENTLTS